MNRSIKIEIKESIEELQALHRAENEKYRAERLLFLYLLNTKQAKSLSQAAKLLMHHRHTMRTWFNKYAEGGLEELLRREEPGGNLPQISDELYQLLDERLSHEGFASYKEAYAFMVERGYTNTYDTAYQLIRREFNTRLNVSRPQHVKQDPEKREAFKKTLLKSSAKRARRSDCSFSG